MRRDLGLVEKGTKANPSKQARVNYQQMMINRCVGWMNLRSSRPHRHRGPALWLPESSDGWRTGALWRSPGVANGERVGLAVAKSSGRRLPHAQQRRLEAPPTRGDWDTPATAE